MSSIVHQTLTGTTHNARQWNVWFALKCIIVYSTLGPIIECDTNLLSAWGMIHTNERLLNYNQNMTHVET